MHIANMINSNAIGIQVGAKTHIHDHSILWVSLSTIKTTVSSSKKVGPIVILVFPNLLDSFFIVNISYISTIFGNKGQLPIIFVIV